MKANILIGLSALALAVVGCVRFLNARSKRNGKPQQVTNDGEEMVLYGLRDGFDVNLYFDADRLDDGTIDVHYSSRIGSIDDGELATSMTGDDVMELRIRTRVIGKEVDYD